MPDLDGGRLFLTVLAPVRTDAMTDPVVGRSRSHQHMLAQKLALIPTGRQTVASDPNGWRSPFSRNTLNHFARFAIIDDPAFNGRVSDDTLVGLLKGTDPLAAQPVDALTSPYLLFAADVDAPQDAAAALKAYALSLWDTMQDDLHVIFSHCVGFDRVEDADGFHAYLRRCQVETTLPFNDYWLDGLPLPPEKPDAGHPGLVKTVLIGAGVLATGWLAVALFACAANVLRLEGFLPRLAAEIAAWGAVTAVGLALLALAAGMIAYRWVLARGAEPFPTAPGATLPDVLKALFLQQQFTRFAAEAQALDDGALHARFGAFLAAVSPAAPEPRLQPGEVSSPRAEWVS